MANTATFRVAAVADLHIKETSPPGEIQELVQKIERDGVDALVLCGDNVDQGTLDEANMLIHELHGVKMPILVVLGNHDYHSEKHEEIRKLFVEHGMIVLEGADYVIEKNGKSLGITGVKGFGGGFKPSMWGRFGEPEQKAFYDASEKELEQLEIGLNALQGKKPTYTIVAMHYSPIRETLEGELQELYAFLGSTRFQEVIDRYEVSAVVHGHSHYGSPEGKTEKGVPVYNVALPLMKKISPEKPYKIIEL